MEKLWAGGVRREAGGRSGGGVSPRDRDGGGVVIAPSHRDASATVVTTEPRPRAFSPPSAVFSRCHADISHRGPRGRERRPPLRSSPTSRVSGAVSTGVIFFFTHAAAPPGVTPLPLGRGDLYSEESNVVEILMLSGSLCRRARVIRRRAAAKTQRHTQSKQWQRSCGRHQEITVTTRRRRSRPEQRVHTPRCRSAGNMAGAPIDSSRRLGDPLYATL